MENNEQNPSMEQPIKKPNSGKSMIWLILGLILILLIGGAYWYLKGQKTTTSQQTPQSSTQPTSDSFDKDLNSIDVQAQDTDFDALDADLKNL